jgi:hypothetical protein
MGLDKVGKSVLAAQGVLPVGQHEQLLSSPPAQASRHRLSTGVTAGNPAERLPSLPGPFAIYIA